MRAAASSAEMEAWLQENTFFCQALNGRVSPGACAAYRSGRRELNAKKHTVPRHCRGCDDAPLARALKSERGTFKPQYHIWREI